MDVSSLSPAQVADDMRAFNAVMKAFDLMKAEFVSTASRYIYTGVFQI